MSEQIYYGAGAEEGLIFNSTRDLNGRKKPTRLEQWQRQ
jgi:hypothetical protein